MLTTAGAKRIKQRKSGVFKMSKFFANVKTVNELRKAFKSLIMKHHPDRGGDTATAQAINAEYDILMDNLINAEDDSVYAKNENGYNFWESRAEHSEVEKKVKEAIQAIIMLDGLEIEVIGVWVWVDGNTKTHKEALKEAGFKWFNKKKKWAFAGKKSGGRGKMDLDEVRAKYGSSTVKKPTSSASSAKRLQSPRKAISAA